MFWFVLISILTLTVCAWLALLFYFSSMDVNRMGDP